MPCHYPKTYLQTLTNSTLPYGVGYPYNPTLGLYWDTLDAYFWPPDSKGSEKEHSSPYRESLNAPLSPHSFPAQEYHEEQEHPVQLELPNPPAALFTIS